MVLHPHPADVRRRVHQDAWTRGRVAHGWERIS